MPAVCKCTDLHVLVLCSLNKFPFILVHLFHFLSQITPAFIICVYLFSFLLQITWFISKGHFEGINWCFVSYSFVSVKGPGRKLSLPTDLKTDLGTVGESQQFSFVFF